MYIQWTLSISNTLYLGLLSISNNFLCPLDISIDSSLIFSLYLESPYLELISISNKNIGPMQMFLSLSRTFQIFEDWVRKIDRKLRTDGRKIALIIDNCPAHLFPVFHPSNSFKISKKKILITKKEVNNLLKKSGNLKNLKFFEK